MEDISNKGFVSLQIGAELLGISVNSLHQKDSRYRRFVHKGKGKMYFFDIDAYRKEVNRQNFLRERFYLLMEYLKHMHDLSYSKISRISGLPTSSMSALLVRADKVEEAIEAIRINNPEYIDDFNEFYDFGENL